MEPFILPLILILFVGTYVIGFLVFLFRGEGWMVAGLWFLFLIIAHSGPGETPDRPQYRATSKEWAAASRDLRG